METPLRRRPILSHCSSATWGEKLAAGEKADQPAPAQIVNEPSWSDFFQLPPIVGDYRPDAAAFIWVPLFSDPFTLVLSGPDGRNLVEVDLKGDSLRLQRYVARVGDFRGTARAEWFCRGALVYSQRVSFHPAGKLAAVSCDYRQLDTNPSLWEEMDPNVDLVVHLGDNIYGDHEFFRALALLRSRRFRRGERRFAAQEIIRAEYEENYRKSWSRWAYHLRHCRHLMIPDDHDVTNGYNSEAFRPGSLQDEVAQVALEVMRRYQGGLEVEKEGEEKLPFLSRWLDEETLLCLCPRTSSGGRSAPPELLRSLTAESAAARKLILGFGAAPLPPAGGFYGGLYSAVYGTDGLWAPGEALSVYEFLEKWQAGVGEDGTVKKNRRSLLLGGDIHIGVQAELSWGLEPEAENRELSDVKEPEPEKENRENREEKENENEHKEDRENREEKENENEHKEKENEESENESLSSPRNVSICVVGPMSNQPTLAEIIYAKGLRESPLAVNSYRIEVRQARALRNYAVVDVKEMTAETTWAGRRYPEKKKNLPKALLQLTGHFNGTSGR